MTRPTPRPTKRPGRPETVPLLHIDYVLDTVCPWCYIGKKRLEQALASRGGFETHLRFRTFLLNPNMPREGIDHATYLGQRYGNEKRVARILKAISEVGATVGIPFAFDRIERAPNSMDSHRLIRLAADFDAADRMVEALYAAFFVEARDIGDPQVLARIARDLGYDRRAVLSYLAGSEGVEGVLADNAWAHRQGANGVPTFMFGGGPALSGAHEPQVIGRLIDVAKELAAVSYPP